MLLGLVLAQWEVVMKRYIVCLIMCVISAGSWGICVETCVLRIYWDTEFPHDIHLRDISQWKSITQTIINTADAFHCGEAFVLLQIIHKMAQLPAISPLLHSSLTDHFARECAVIDCVYVLSPLCDWWSEMCVYHSVHSMHAAVLGCTQNEPCRWNCV